jgi:hypothetical protein
METIDQIKYNELLNNYMQEVPGKMFTFELTKCCGYSTLIFMYKEESLINLYQRVSYHMLCDVISLYILKPDGSRLTIPLNSSKTIKEFVYEQTNITNRNMTPLYDLPVPVVYRIYFDDGYHHENCNIILT